MNHLKGKINNISKINNLKIKSLKKVNSDISKQIRNSSVIDIKKEIKELETLDINDFIKKTKNRKKNNRINNKGKSLIESSFIFDLSKIKENKREQVSKKI